jgi:hypothetical protein
MSRKRGLTVSRGKSKPPEMLVGTAKWKEVVPKPLQKPLKAALTAMEASDYKTALYWFGKCAEIDPFSKPVLYFGATCASAAYFGMRGAGTEAPPHILDGWRQCAETLTKAAYEVAPDDAVACHNVGRFIQDCGDDTEAIRYYQQAAALDNGQVETWANWGTALAQLGDLKKANEYWDRAIHLEPRHSSGMLAQSYIHLRRENFADGWRLFEARWRDLEFVRGYGRKDLHGKIWHGEPLKAGESVFFHGEQGLGDHVQFARFVRAAKDRGIPVFGLETRGQLKRWMANAMPDVEMFVRDTDKPTGYTHHASFMSLPYLLGTTIDTIPPPLAPHIALPTRFEGPTRKVGIAWHGAAGNPADYLRSIPHDQLGYLADVPNVTWVNLQFDPNADLRLRAWLGNGCLDGTKDCRDVYDTAQVIAGLDLVVSVDTLTAHLAGSLGVPTLLLQRYAREWRWSGDGEETLWYPSVRQITQSQPKEWGDVLGKVRDLLGGGLHTFFSKPTGRSSIDAHRESLFSGLQGW